LWFFMLSRKACHASLLVIRTDPVLSLLSRTPTRPPPRPATSTQSPLKALHELFRHTTSRETSAACESSTTQSPPRFSGAAPEDVALAPCARSSRLNMAGPPRLDGYENADRQHLRDQRGPGQRLWQKLQQEKVPQNKQRRRLKLRIVAIGATRRVDHQLGRSVPLNKCEQG
jgi:hypothetical protein